jgi:mannosylglycerate hydrolase
MRKIVDNMPQSDADKLVMFNLMPWPREEVMNTTIRLRASQFRLRDDKGNEIPYFIRSARELDPGSLTDRLSITAITNRLWSLIFSSARYCRRWATVRCLSNLTWPGSALRPKTPESLLENAFWQIDLMTTERCACATKKPGLFMTACWKSKRARMMAMSTTTRLRGKSGGSLQRRASMTLRLRMKAGRAGR